jgi:hypothetical protein
MQVGDEEVNGWSTANHRDGQVDPMIRQTLNG